MVFRIVIFGVRKVSRFNALASPMEKSIEIEKRPMIEKLRKVRKQNICYVINITKQELLD